MDAKMKRYTFIIFAILLFGACEKEYTPDPPDELQYVVEGILEFGDPADDPAPPYVLLTKSSPFINTFDEAFFNNLFVHDAIVEISGPNQKITLQEFCLNDLPQAIRDQAAQSLGFDPDSLFIDVCAYVDLSGSLILAEGESYQLNIEVEGETLSASTTIPPLVPIDTFRTERVDNAPDFRKMLCKITDPGDQLNYYRYFVAEEDGPFVSGFSSVVDDLFFNGLEFEFQLNKPLPPEEDFDPDLFGLFSRRTNYTVKWATMDEAHFQFWNTLEFNKANEGPFSSYTRVASNIEGGLGIFGAYHIKKDSIFVR